MTEGMKKRSHTPSSVEDAVQAEEELARIEADARRQQMANDSERDFRDGRFYTEAEVREALRKGKLDELIESRERKWQEL